MYVYSRSVLAYSDKAKKEKETMLRMAQVELCAYTFMYLQKTLFKYINTYICYNY
jgi:hypothetical protein